MLGVRGCQMATRAALLIFSNNFLPFLNRTIINCQILINSEIKSETASVSSDKTAATFRSWFESLYQIRNIATSTMPSLLLEIKVYDQTYSLFLLYYYHILLGNANTVVHWLINFKKESFECRAESNLTIYCRLNFLIVNIPLGAVNICKKCKDSSR